MSDYGQAGWLWLFGEEEAIWLRHLHDEKNPFFPRVNLRRLTTGSPQLSFSAHSSRALDLILLFFYPFSFSFFFDSSPYDLLLLRAEN